MGGQGLQELRVIERTEDGIVDRAHRAVRFVPLTRDPEPEPGPEADAGAESGR